MIGQREPGQAHHSRRSEAHTDRNLILNLKRKRNNFRSIGCQRFLVDIQHQVAPQRRADVGVATCRIDGELRCASRIDLQRQRQCQSDRVESRSKIRRGRRKSQMELVHRANPSLHARDRDAVGCSRTHRRTPASRVCRTASAEASSTGISERNCHIAGS